MNRSTRSSGVSDDLVSDDPPLTAELLQRDFSGLIAIFDHHLATLSPDDGQAWKHITQAKAAAERGLKLSRELIDLEKTPD